MFKFTKLLTLLLLLNVSCAFALDTPTEDFIDNKDGTVTHKKTRLTWQRCSVGQTWTGSNCNGSTNVFRYLDSLSQTSNFAGYSDWRIPRIDEIASIVEHGAYNPAINSIIFPNTPTGFYAPYTFLNYMFWSSTFVASNPDRMHVVNFTTGEILPDDRRSTNTSLMNDYRSIRFVRGGHSLSILDEFTPLSDFLDNGNGTVTHTKTGLSWQRCSVGQTWTGTSCSGSASRMTYASAMLQTSSLSGYSDWRLPTLSELQTIVEYKNDSPSVNSTLFPNTPFSTRTDTIWFWSASVPVYNNNRSSEAYVVMFQNGGVNTIYDNSNFAVRLVRGTWTAPTIATPTITAPVTPTTIDLSTTLSQTSSRVKINENIIYTATVTNNGTGTANNSLLKIYLPPRNVSVVSMPSDCVVTGKSLTCSLGNLAAGANASRAITVTYIKSGGASLSALVLTDSNDTNSANNVSRVVTSITK